MTGPKRVTEKQLAANRANAQRSTGPRTPAGKARSRWNALTHGALDQAVIPPALEPYESCAACDELLASLHASLAPASPMEEILVERIAVSYWRLARPLQAESSAIALNQENLRFQQAYPDARVSDGSTAMDAYTIQNNLLAELRAALPVPERLRDLMVSVNTSLAQADDEQVHAAAQRLIVELEAKLPDLRARTAAMQRKIWRVPASEQALSYSRYEAALERQLYRALDALERLQRRRLEEEVAPPLKVDLDAALPQ
ncbi:MAG: hypothetical protein ACYC6L_13500 [Anaerolineae bacterium]